MYKLIAIIGLLIVGIAGYIILSSNSSEKPTNSNIIFTQIPSDQNPLSNENDLIPNFESSRIVSLEYENPNGELSNLTKGFYAAAYPSLSFEARKIIFSAKKSKEDPWQIWSMDVNGSDKQQVTNNEANCLSPAYLPDGTIVYSKELLTEKTGKNYQLFVCQNDGSNEQQITFHPSIDFYSSVLHDGRISLISQEVYPDQRDPEFMVLRPDGTQFHSFVELVPSAFVSGKVCESNDHQLLMIERTKLADRLISRAYANPAKKYKELISFPLNRLHSFDLMDSDQVILSYQSLKNGVFSLYTLNDNGAEKLLFMDDKYHSIQPIFIRKREVPKKLPSTISWETGTGTLVCQNSNTSEIKIEGDPQTKYIQVFNTDRLLSDFEVAEDGSFYLKVQSDMPFRFQSLDENREILRGPSAWIWMRANERKGCVGCHEKKGITPDNIVPQAINNPPIWVTDTSSVANTEQIVWEDPKGGDHEN